MPVRSVFSSFFISILKPYVLNQDVGMFFHLHMLFELFGVISDKMQKFSEGKKNHLKMPCTERARLQAQTAELQNRRTDGQTLS